MVCVTLLSPVTGSLDGISCASNIFGFNFSGSRPNVTPYFLLLPEFNVDQACFTAVLYLQFFHFPFYLIKWLSVYMTALYYMCVYHFHFILFVRKSYWESSRTSTKSFNASVWFPYLSLWLLFALVADCLNEMRLLLHVWATRKCEKKRQALKLNNMASYKQFIIFRKRITNIN